MGQSILPTTENWEEFPVVVHYRDEKKNWVHVTFPSTKTTFSMNPGILKEILEENLQRAKESGNIIFEHKLKEPGQ